MFPHLGVGRGTDSPRKASEPSRTMMVATVIRPKETTAGITLGRISRKMIRRSLAPRCLGRQHEVAVGEGEGGGPHHPEDQTGTLPPRG